MRVSAEDRTLFLSRTLCGPPTWPNKATAMETFAERSQFSRRCTLLTTVTRMDLFSSSSFFKNTISLADHLATVGDHLRRKSQCGGLLLLNSVAATVADLLCRTHPVWWTAFAKQSVWWTALTKHSLCDRLPLQSSLCDRLPLQNTVCVTDYLYKTESV